jgi:hypothetical protein
LTTNIVEGGQSWSHLHLHVNRTRFDTLESYRGNALDHELPQSQRRLPHGMACSKNIYRTKVPHRHKKKAPPEQGRGLGRKA